MLHLPAALASDLVEIVAFIDPAVHRAAAMARGWGLQPEIGARIEDIRGPIDGAIIATPNDTHRALAVACAARGIHCLIEKPLATTVEDAEAICHTAKEQNVTVAVGYATRFRNQVVLLKHLLDTGYFGTVSRFYFKTALSADGLRSPLTISTARRVAAVCWSWSAPIFSTGCFIGLAIPTIARWWTMPLAARGTLRGDGTLSPRRSPDRRDHSPVEGLRSYAGSCDRGREGARISGIGGITSGVSAMPKP